MFFFVRPVLYDSIKNCRDVVAFENRSKKGGRGGERIVYLERKFSPSHTLLHLPLSLPSFNGFPRDRARDNIKTNCGVTSEEVYFSSCIKLNYGRGRNEGFVPRTRDAQHPSILSSLLRVRLGEAEEWKNKERGVLLSWWQANKRMAAGNTL